MKKEIQNELLNRTWRILTKWNNQDMTELEQSLDEKITWIGAGVQQYYAGIEEVQAALTNCHEEMPVLALSEQNYQVADIGSDYCIVMGSYRATLDEPGKFLSEIQRITFVWRLRKKDWKLVHIHLSNAAAFMEEQEEFPVKASKEAYRFISQKIQSEQVELYSNDGSCHRIEKREVYYLEGANEYTLVHLRGGVIRVRASMYKLKSELFPEFLIIHRCYYINPDAVRIVKASEVVMNNEDALPISRSRSQEIGLYFSKHAF